MAEEQNIKIGHVLYTHSRAEFKVDRSLKAKDIEVFLHVKKTLKQWSDRKKEIIEVLFTSYIFIFATEKERLLSLEDNLVVRCLCDNGKPAIILMSVWKSFGYNMIIFIAGLQNIPEDLYEAASIEGASGWQKFKSITIPMLAPTTIFISLITMIGYFQFFAEPYIMTQGGPLNSTLSVVQYMYQEGFKWWNMGYSASIAFVFFFIIMNGTLIQLKIQKSTE